VFVTCPMTASVFVLHKLYHMYIDNDVLYKEWCCGLGRKSVMKHMNNKRVSRSFKEWKNHVSLFDRKHGANEWKTNQYFFKEN